MEGLQGGANAIILLFTAMVVGLALVRALVAWKRGRCSLARTLSGGAALLAVSYGGSLLVTAAASQQKILAAGEPKWFCGFYIDCHLGVSVDGVKKTASIPSATGPLRASDNFYIVTLRLHNSAKNPELDMLLYHPRVEIVDAAGNRYGRSAPAEGIIAGRKPVLGEETSVPHETLTRTVIFDLPSNVQRPRLLIEEGWLGERLVELALLGDENSLLHRPTLIALDPRDARMAMR